ncbi:hypothetical protein [Cellulosimicrobium composti]|uniref:Chemotaxis methyl-accepting receptor HlyB-like 4HB MCP domain-containing protein n=1 Tax=Cellulosimicrobium composti TaxID=2672572 RepID=A0ABX0BEW6_9MICO|nr:hypothetical protein [Cellulosimicrobium composti]NDO91073.1 hypothetical protein [Cellulosimicrobium composti]TWG81028.1 hypothetical protein L603_003600000060 [Cellulosimicrobium cellulans J34]SMF49240.1 hypothetical protein SAMN02744115_03616 [Cellulosimicrobium cellulans J1]
MTTTPVRPAGQPTAPASGTAPGTSAPAPAAAPPARASRARRALRRTPGKLRLVMALCVLAALALGVLGFQAGSVQSRALEAASEDAAQLVGVQEVRNALVAADATATGAFLVGGLEPADQRARYDDLVDQAATRLATLSGSNEGDAALLGEVAADLTVYTGLVEQARANNRQGFPVGSAYLDQASTILREQMLPTLDEVVLDDADRVAADFSGVRNALWVLAGGLLALAVLLASQVWLARRTHRVLNVGLAVATGVVLVVGVVATVLLAQASSRAQDVRTGPYAATLAASQAYSLGNDAKSMEAFTLIKRGSGQAYEEAFVTATDDAAARLDAAAAEGILDGSTAQALDAWVARHAEIRALDDDGRWDEAVALATATDPESPNAAFDAFSASARDDIETGAAATSDRLDGAATTATVAGWLVLVAGLVAALLAWRGVSARLEEYR